MLCFLLLLYMRNDGAKTFLLLYIRALIAHWKIMVLHKRFMTLRGMLFVLLLFMTMQSGTRVVYGSFYGARIEPQAALVKRARRLICSCHNAQLFMDYARSRAVRFMVLSRLPQSSVGSCEVSLMSMVERSSHALPQLTGINFSLLWFVTCA